MIEIALLDENQQIIKRSELHSLFEMRQHGNGVRFQTAAPVFMHLTPGYQYWGYQWVIGELKSVTIPFDDGVLSIPEDEPVSYIQITPFFDAPFEDMNAVRGMSTRV